ncbi:hypothetical protein D1114_07180 [Cereibacter sphaeroides]|uniref:Uncharacterized protein n=1 Tax=Cereibacter sphaeroides TaxID=1063 RepID=A0AAX1UP20_CERSP|nr:hypothetical protein [Cereibacter sphaeroides]RHZ96484.1 hypothetical protein D1114_07180 [Cereibacter sphaeroides]
MPDLIPSFASIPLTVWRDAPPEADALPEPEHRLMPGWWLFPATVCGCAIWAAIIRAILA